MRDFRCPYCVSDGQFRLMTTADNGHYTCQTCGHEVAPSEAAFKCDCLKCLVWLKTFSISLREHNT